MSIFNFNRRMNARDLLAASEKDAKDRIARGEDLRQSPKAEVNGNEATIYLYDAIGGWWGMSAKQFAKDLAEIDADVIHLRVNSPGGDVFEARAMQTCLREHSAKIIAHIDGLAASAATYLVFGADEIDIVDGGFFMIHNAWMFTWGNASELMDDATFLQKIDATIAKDYHKRTGLSLEQITTWMDEETWFTAEEAVNHGFVDSISDADEVDDDKATNNIDKVVATDTTDADDPIFNTQANERHLALIEHMGR